MKASDIPEQPILAFLAAQTRWSTHWPSLGGEGGMPCIPDAVPGFPPKVLLAKLSQMKKRGLLNGCPCGCRGDWEITDKGREALR